MDSDMFSGVIEDKRIALEDAPNVARFSFIVQKSVSYLDLECPISGITNYFDTVCDSCRSRDLSSFVNTEEKCRKFFAPSRRLFYTLSLDLPNGRGRSLKENIQEYNFRMECCGSPHMAEIIVAGGFYDDLLSNFIEEALSINIPKEKISKWILRFPYEEVPLLARLGIRLASQFLDLFYPEFTDLARFVNFIQQFDIFDWMAEFEDPNILEYLLYHARHLGNLGLDGELDAECASVCIYYKHYRNIGPLLKYISDSVPSLSDYEDYLFQISEQRPLVDQDVIEIAEESMARVRICRILQIVWVYIDADLHNLHEAASEALGLIWSSIPDACITLEELHHVFRPFLEEAELANAYKFYVAAIGESSESVQPRSLTHLCRVALRRTFETNRMWIPHAIWLTRLPNILQSFLNLD